MAVGKYLPEANPGPTEDVAVTIKNILEGLGGGSQLSHDQLDDVSADDHHTQSHGLDSHSDTTGTGAELDTLTDNSMADTLHRHSELSASDGTPDAVVSVDSDGILYADAAPLGFDILYSGVIGTHLTVGNDIIVGGTVDGVDIAARDHAESHSVASHNDTTATGAELDELTDASETTLHSHAAGATKEFFIPVSAYAVGGALGSHGDFPAMALLASTDYAYFVFVVPLDFNSITEAVLETIPILTSIGARIDIWSDYAAEGQAYNTHSEEQVATTHDQTTNIIYEKDISPILSALVAGDIVGIKAKIDSVSDQVSMLGIRLKYS